MSCHLVGDEVRYRSVRKQRGAREARFAGRYRPVGGPFNLCPGTLEHFLTERYCLYSASRGATSIAATSTITRGPCDGPSSRWSRSL